MRSPQPGDRGGAGPGVGCSPPSEAQPPVGRTVGPVTATGVVVANMIGSGVFVTSGIIAGNLPGPAAVLCCWTLGGLIALCGALCYGELATRMPRGGGEYVYLKELFHPLLGFLTGWVSFLVGFSAPIAASAMGCSQYLLAGLDGNASPALGLTPAQHREALAVMVILLFTLLHYAGIERGSRIQNVLTAAKVGVILVMSCTGLLWGEGHWSNLRLRADAPVGGFAFGTAMMLVMFAYSGWNASAYIAGEIRRPGRTIPVSLVSGTLIVGLVYIAINLFVLRSLPFAEVRANAAVVEGAAARALGSGVGDAVGVVIALALLSSVSALLMIGPRVCFAMARDGLFFRWAGQVHPKYRVPGRSILMQGGIAALMVVFSSIEQLVVFLMYAMNVFPWLAVLGLFVARRRNVGDLTAVKAPGYPLTPIFFLASTFLLAIVAFANRPVESTAAILLVLAGVPCFYLWPGRDRTPVARGVRSA